MIGFVMLILLMLLSIGGLRLLRVRGAALTASAAAVLIGGAGYALQGSPGLPAAPAQNMEARDFFPLTQARHAFFGEFSPEESWMPRNGSPGCIIAMNAARLAFAPLWG